MRSINSLNRIKADKNFDFPEFVTLIANNVRFFEPRPASHFEYAKSHQISVVLCKKVLLGLAEVGLDVGRKDGAELPPHAANAFGAVIEVSLEERIEQLLFLLSKANNFGRSRG